MCNTLSFQQKLKRFFADIMTESRRKPTNQPATKKKITVKNRKLNKALAIMSLN
jgi:hypothetical protein